MVSKTFVPLTVVLLTYAQLSCAQTRSELSSTLVVVISGNMSDASADQISHKAPRGRGSSGMYQLMGDLQRAGFKTVFFNWNGNAAGKSMERNAPGAKAIVAAIREVYAKDKFGHLVLVGHSWGGHTMLEVAEALNSEPIAKIDLAIGVDPSSIARGKRASQLPPNICKLVCFHTRNVFTWGAWTDEARVEKIDLGDPKNGFMIDGKPNYAAAFDPDAHIAVEWDQRIHADLVSRIKKSVAGQPSSGVNASKPHSATVNESP